MIAYLVRRIPVALLTALAASAVIFLLVRAAPGSPASVVAGPDATPELVADIERELGLDRPLVVQYLLWLRGLFTGDLGDSVIFQQPIAELIGERLLSTIELAAAATLFMVVIGLLLGVVGGSSRSQAVRRALDTTFSVLLALPTYVSAVLLILVFGVLVPGVLPTGGETLLVVDPVEGLRTLLLPAVALAIPHSAVVGRLLQTSMREAMREDYVRAADAKGLTRRRVLWVHVLRNSMSTAVVAIGIRFGALLGGAVLVEALFARNGVGQLLVLSVLSRDYGVVQTLILMAVVIAIVMQLLSELALAALDPRVRLA